MLIYIFNYSVRKIISFVVILTISNIPAQLHVYIILENYYFEISKHMSEIFQIYKLYIYKRKKKK